jgi:hypothetical protein
MLLYLASQEMKVLGRCGRIAHLYVVTGTEGEISLEMTARMFRTLTLITVRQKEYEPGAAAPLFLS